MSGSHIKIKNFFTLLYSFCYSWGVLEWEACFFG